MFGTAKLVNKHGKCFLHIPVSYEIEESNISDICNVVGIDRGINFVVIKVNPRYTSQCCPVCGHMEKTNRNKKIHLFCCKNCGYKSNDDRIGAMNLYHMGINYLADSQVPDTVTAE